MEETQKYVVYAACRADPYLTVLLEEDRSGTHVRGPRNFAVRKTRKL